MVIVSGKLLYFFTLYLIKAAFVMLSLTFAISIFQQDPTDSTEQLSKPHARIEVFHLTAKTILTILFVSLEHEHTFYWLLTFSCVVIFGLDWALTIWFLPFYRWRYNVLRSINLSILLWASICLVLVMALHSNSNSITVIFFLMLPLIGVGTVYALKTRKQSITTCLITSSTHPFTVELKVMKAVRLNILLG